MIQISPVIINFFINFDFPQNILREQFNVKESDEWFEEINNNKEETHRQEWPCWSLPSLWCENFSVSVASQPSLGVFFDWEQKLIWQKLVGATHPICKSQVKYRCKLRSSHYNCVKSIVIHRRLLIYIVEHSFLDKVKDSHSKDSNWEQHRQTEPIHKCHKDSIQHHTVLVVHQIDWTWVEIYIALYGGLFGWESISSKPSVQQSKDKSHCPIYGKVKKWVKCIKDHRGYKHFSSLPKESRIEVSLVAINYAKRKWLLF